MEESRILSSGHPTAAASSSFLARSHPGLIDERIAATEPGPSLAKRPRVAAEPPAPGGSAPGPEAEARALVSMARGIYPLARAEALRGLAVVLEEMDAGGGAGRGVVECCYACAVDLMRDDDEGVRLAAVRLKYVRRSSLRENTLMAMAMVTKWT
uniref:Uncharacterized protein n=1 Tax=Arundo donax TaxID=35708 RepID=A0A0A9G4P6_ARUDO